VQPPSPFRASLGLAIVERSRLQHSLGQIKADWVLQRRGSDTYHVISSKYTKSFLTFFNYDR